MRNIVMKLWKDEEGPTAVEYALMLFLLVVGVLGATQTLRDAVIATFKSAATTIGG